MDEIIQKILQKIQSQPNQDIEESIYSAISDLGLNSEDIETIKEAFSTIDTIQEYASDLSAKRKNGLTRNGWIKEQLCAIEEQSGDKAKIVIEQIEDGVQRGFNHASQQ
ncbi:MAG: hypothetical protein K2G07_04400 [Muribaculaceae bacterium]|nr:hypothetical protein [Muribaculaceae bacterium]